MSNEENMAKVNINQWPVDERPRERLLAAGPEHLSPAQLLAIVLRTGSEGKSAIELAMEVLQHYGDFRAIAGATVHELCSIKGIGPAKAAQIKAAFEIGKRVAAEPLSKKIRILSSKDVYNIYRHYTPYFQGLKKEIFKLLMLDGKTEFMPTTWYQKGVSHQALFIRGRFIFRLSGTLPHQLSFCIITPAGTHPQALRMLISQRDSWPQEN